MTFTSQTQASKLHPQTNCGPWAPSGQPSYQGVAPSPTPSPLPLSPVLRTEGAVGESRRGPSPCSHAERTVTLTVTETQSSACPPAHLTLSPTLHSVYLLSPLSPEASLLPGARLSSVLLLSLHLCLSGFVSRSFFPSLPWPHPFRCSPSIYPRLLPSPFKTSPALLGAAGHIPGPGKTKS